MSLVTNSRSLVRFHKYADRRLRLFCFPYAGGSAATFREWFKALDAHVDVVAVEYPGRGGRRRETPLKRVCDIVDMVAPDIDAQIDRPFALFGHSMGGLVVYELLQRLVQRGVQPACVFMSGCRPPLIKRPEKNLHQLSDTEFIEELRKFNGTPEALLGDAELMSLAMPILRADFEAVATYPQSGEAKMSCPVFAYGGMNDDNVTLDELEGWRDMTRAQCTVRVFPGDHFFLHSEGMTLLRVLLRDIVSCT